MREKVVVVKLDAAATAQRVAVGPDALRAAAALIALAPVARRVEDIGELLDAEDSVDEEHEHDQRADVDERRDRDDDSHDDGAQLLGRLDDAQDAHDAEEAEHADERRGEGQAIAREPGEHEVEDREHHERKIERVPAVLEVLLEAEADHLEDHLDDVDAGEEIVHDVEEVHQGLVHALVLRVVQVEAHDHQVEEDGDHDEDIELVRGDHLEEGHSPLLGRRDSLPQRPHREHLLLGLDPLGLVLRHERAAVVLLTDLREGVDDDADGHVHHDEAAEDDPRDKVHGRQVLVGRVRVVEAVLIEQLVGVGVAVEAPRLDVQLVHVRVHGGEHHVGPALERRHLEDEQQARPDDVE
eukprot:1689636-Prymnesium_polylepis.1